MKKILILIFLFYPVLLSAQPSLGDGSSGNPYRGTLTSNWTFNEVTKYFGNLDVQSGKFTIAAGSTLLFGTGDTLSITGTGIISAVGNISNKIIFTASGTSWGHIYIYSASSTTSEIKYCLIEKGDVSSLSGHTYGGGIRIGSSNVLIENCEIKNDKATHGGGIFVGKAINPTISKCYIHNNQATASGGGTYFWTDSYSSVSNCLITYNTAGSGGGGGVFLGGKAKNVTIYNSVISHNSASSATYGHNIRFNNNTNTPKPKFVNSIIWYPVNSIVYLSGGSPLAADFEYCAIQSPPITYNNCITLNADNTNPAGPNFIATDGSDWSLNYVSPCIDKGLDHSSDPNVPLTDYVGNSRVGQTDIGAYEWQYFIWQGDDISNPTLWNDPDNWSTNAVPSGNESIYIPSGLTNYPTGSSPNFSIASGKTFIMAPGAKATFGTLINNGTLKLESDASSIASLMTDSFSGSDATIELYLTGGDAGDKAYRWHYISSPISSLPVSTFAPTYTYNVVGWYDSRVSTTLAQGWVAYDGYIYSTGSMGGPTFSSFTPGIGYDYYDSVDDEYTFSGQFNTSSLNMSLSYAVADALHGFNLIGNPYPCGLNWDVITSNPSYPANTSKWITYTKDNTQYTYNNGVGVPEGTDGHIPPMQGVFIRTFSSGNSLPILLSAREHNSTSRYKGLESEIPLIRLKINENNISDETVVRFDENAKPGIDYDFDAIKMFVSSSSTQIYSKDSEINYIINGLPFPDTIVEIPIVVNFLTTGNHTILTTQLQGLDYYDVTLTDKITGFVSNLKTNPELIFSSSAGTISDRFVLKVTNVLTGIENPIISKNIFNIYHGFGILNIQTLSDEWDGQGGAVKIYDLTGKIVSETRNLEFWKNSLIQIQAPYSKGLYVVEIKLGMKRYVGKVIIK